MGIAGHGATFPQANSALIFPAPFQLHRRRLLQPLMMVVAFFQSCGSICRLYFAEDKTKLASERIAK
jgi:hypothetical protein